MAALTLPHPANTCCTLLKISPSPHPTTHTSTHTCCTLLKISPSPHPTTHTSTYTCCTLSKIFPPHTHLITLAVHSQRYHTHPFPHLHTHIYTLAAGGNVWVLTTCSTFSHSCQKNVLFVVCTTSGKLSAPSVQLALKLFHLVGGAYRHVCVCSVSGY